MNQAERDLLKKSLDAQIAKIKLPVEDGKIIKNKIVTKTDDIIEKKIDNIEIAKPLKKLKRLQQNQNVRKF